MIRTNAHDEAALVARWGLVHQRAESADRGRTIVECVGYRRLEAQTRAIDCRAGVVSSPIVVIAQAETSIGFMKIAETDQQFGLAIALEAGSRHYVEDAIGAVAILG